MSDSLDKVSAFTGLSRTDLKSIHEQVKANHAKLEACDAHDFSIPIDRITLKEINERVFGCKWSCKHCGGNVDGQSKYWYLKGVLHGMRQDATEPSQQAASNPN